MAGVSMPEVPGCEELLNQRALPEPDMSEAAVEARLEEYERVMKEYQDRQFAQLFKSNEGEEKEAPPVFPILVNNGGPTPPHFPFTPKRSRDTRDMFATSSTPDSPHTSGKKPRNDTECEEESKEWVVPTRLRFV